MRSKTFQKVLTKKMGMYDHVRIDSKLLPLNDEQLEAVKGADWQTKDVYNHLDVIHIYGDGSIEIEDGETHEIDSFRDEQGHLEFYSDGRDGKWYEFEVTIKKGKVVKIQGGQSEL